MVKSSFKDLKKSMQNEGGSDVLVNGHLVAERLVRLQSWILGDHGWVDKLKRGFGMRVPRIYARRNVHEPHYYVVSSQSIRVRLS
ncbi:hypothetical protein Bca4012_028439 [Brassica carinata]|uniref:Uncharacterized protein n=1 Tax=Brassica carinata TaxID=52824 RepID=A0A8X7RPD6_BRACI|nr:hypothetical protein Bca52824_049984 [Brassica carinata]